MLYLSRAEQLALAMLIVLLLAGSGLLVYQRGVQAGRAAKAEPLLLEPPPPAQAPQPLAEAPPSGPQDPPAGEARPAALPTSSTTPRAARQPARPPAGKLHLNTATAQDLDALPGI